MLLKKGLHDNLPRASLMSNLHYIDENDTTIMTLPQDDTAKVDNSNSGTENPATNVDQENGTEGQSSDKVNTVGSKPNGKLTEKLIEGGAYPKRLTLTMAEYKNLYVNEMEKEKDNMTEEELTPLQKVLDILTLPGKMLCMIMIPNVDEEMMNKWYVPAMPLISMAACIILTKSTR